MRNFDFRGAGLQGCTRREELPIASAAICSEDNTIDSPPPFALGHCSMVIVTLLCLYRALYDGNFFDSNRLVFFLLILHCLDPTLVATPRGFDG